MFTGIVTALGKVTQIDVLESCHRLVIQTDLDLSDGQLGESIAVNGCCLTVVELLEQGFAVDVAHESLQVTTLGALKVGDPVNLERALRVSDRLGGHWVQGHVDAVGQVKGRTSFPQGELWVIAFPNEWARYLVPKGSITVNGVSLTVNSIVQETFELFLIPHTLQHTTFAFLNIGDAVNLEFDILGKYMERLMTTGAIPSNPSKS